MLQLFQYFDWFVIVFLLVYSLLCTIHLVFVVVNVMHSVTVTESQNNTLGFICNVI